MWQKWIRSLEILAACVLLLTEFTNVSKQSIGKSSITVMNMHRRILASLFSAAIAIPMLSNWVDAQTPINQLQQRPPSTTVSGKVIRAVGNDFILEDSTGQIIVDAGPRWWQEINLQPGEQIKVTGELGRSGELDAFAIVRADGSVINIRSAEGPPPWAGGPKDKRPKPKSVIPQKALP
jgi:hypothetical protein